MAGHKRGIGRADAPARDWETTEMAQDFTASDLQALEGAAEFFESLATGADPAPLAFAQSIRRVIPDLQMTLDMDAELGPGPTPEEQADLDAFAQGAWDRVKHMFPAAKVINDNQPGNAAIIEVLCDPPTLPVGTLLYASNRNA